MFKHPIGKMEEKKEKFMKIAIEEAKKSAKKGNYALGAVVVDKKGKIISACHTILHKTNDPSAHAEMNAIREAAKKLKSRYLPGTWLYTTQEPCPMCTSVAIWAKMEGIVFGAFEQDAIKIFKKNAKGKFTWRQIKIPAKYVVAKGEPKLKIYEGFMRKECLKLYNLQ